MQQQQLQQQQQGITANISKHLSSLRMNSNSRRTSSTSIISPNQSIQTTESNTQIFSQSNSLDLQLNHKKTEFNPLDPDSFSSELISSGLDMIRVTRRKKIRRTFKLSLFPTITLSWNSKSKSKKIELDKIQSIRIADDAKNYREKFNISSEFNDLWITVIYISSSSTNSSSSLSKILKTLHMIAPTKRNFDVMLNTLTKLSKWSKEQESLIACTNIHDFSKNKWDNKVKNLDREYLSFDDVLKLTLELQIYMDKSYLIDFFNQCDLDKKNYLNFQQFQNFVYKLRYRSELNTIFNDLNIKDGKMNLINFKYFLKNIQFENNLDNDSILDLFNKFSFNNNNTYLTLSDLSNFLRSSYSKPLINDDLNDENYYSYPLTDYFISSSHNTYLLGKQIHGFSSIEGYIHALQRGCRCIEIDVWDSSLTDQHPIVTHGRTLTNSIDFKLVIDIIKKYAFITNPYPLIISLEIKCSIESQFKCINIMKSILGNMLVIKPINNENILPSPKDLKNKILLKIKNSKLTTIIEPSENRIHSSFSTSSTQSEDFNNNSSNDEKNNGNNNNFVENNSNSFKKIVSKSTSKTIIIPELTSLSPYLVGTKFRNFSLPESKTFNHVFSFSDRSLLILLKDKTKLISILKHNKRGLMRIYPSVVRYKSDNYNPISFWELGCQMVATNWQIWDCGEEICESLFKSTKSDLYYSGYRLKPKSLRKFENITDKEMIKIQTLNSLNFNKEHYFDISIISGQQLPKPKDLGNINSNGYTPWVEIEVYNVKPIHAEIVHLHKFNDYNNLNEETDDIEEEINQEKIDINNNMNSGIHNSNNFNAGSVKLFDTNQFSSNPNFSVLFKSRLAENENNAFSPKWNASCRLKYLTNENELSFIRIVVKTLRVNKQKVSVIGKVSNAVKNNNNECIIGSWCCKIGDLKQGYRNIRLGDNKGEDLIYSSLFIKISKKM